jgi:GNAT superfamily N-acetyltransferase
MELNERQDDATVTLTGDDSARTIQTALKAKPSRFGAGKFKVRLTPNRVGGVDTMEILYDPEENRRFSEDAEFRGRGLGSRLLKEKRSYLYGLGDYTSARAVGGHWAHAIDAPEGLWREWHSARQTVDAEGWCAQSMQTAITEFQRTGHTYLAERAQEIHLEGMQSRTTEWHQVSMNLKTDWLTEVAWYGGWTRQGCKGNIISWNLGPLGYLLSLNQIRETLELGAPIVMFQELRFPKGARGKVKKELKRLNANYECFLEAGIDRLGTESSRDDYGWCSKLNFAVAVFLHREAFNIKQSKRVEWASTQQSKELIRLARGRVQWIDAVTKEGKAMFIVNVHQRVGQDIKLQKVVWEALQDKVTKKEGLPGILGGDLNASIKGGR